MDDLIALLPAHLRRSIENPDEITEFIVDVGRSLELRYGKVKVFRDDLPEVTFKDVDGVTAQLGIFGPDNRAGLPRTLHRVSKLVNRDGQVTGLTCRVGRPYIGCAEIIADLIAGGKSILLLGAPGVGKTSKLRDLARYASLDLDKSVVIVDTSNEIAGDGYIPHPAVGRARRLQVPLSRTQPQVMQEAVENHTPEVLIIDEIGNCEEAKACLTYTQRGVQLIATAHGRTLEELILNDELNVLLGGMDKAAVSDATMEEKGSKFVVERIFPPAFNVVVELVDYNTVRVYSDTKSAVDGHLKGEPVLPETRTLVNGRVVRPKPIVVTPPPVIRRTRDDEAAKPKRHYYQRPKEDQPRKQRRRR